MNIQHKELAAGRWAALSLIEQLANVGSEVERTIKWKEKGNADYSNRAFERCLELLDFTLADKKNRKRLREIARTREALVDHFAGENCYNTTDEQWQKYFYSFAYAARAHR